MNPKFGISWIFLIFGILGYFGVSDADAVLGNHPQGYSPTVQNTNNNNNNNNKLRGNGHEISEEERLLDQVVINALANPSEWVHLRQLFERVDEEVSRGGNPKGANTNRNSSSSTTSTSTSASSPSSMSLMNEELMSSSAVTSSKTSSLLSEKLLESPKPKFSYHRVIEGSRKGRPFAAVTLMDSEAIPSALSLPPPEHLRSRIEDEEERYSWNKMRVGHHHETRHSSHRNHHSHHHERNDGHHHTHSQRNNHHHHQH